MALPKDTQTQPLYAADGSYVGEGAQGKVVTPGADPTAGGIQKVVTAGEQAIDQQQIESQVVNPNTQPLSKVFNWGAAKGNPQGKVTTETSATKIASARNAITNPAPSTNPAPDNTTATPDAEANNTSTDTEVNRTPPKADRHDRKTLNKDGSVTPTDTTGTNEANANDDYDAANEQESVVKSFKDPNVNPYTGTTGGDQTNANLAAPDAPANSQASAPKDTSTQGDTEDPYAVTKEQYDAIKAKDPKDWTRQEALQVATYESKPTMPADGGTYTPSQPPAYIAFNGNYNDAYKRMLDLMKANGDDPETKAKRAKARRAAKTIALLGDALAALANIWAASRGATSAKLSSASKAVADETNREEALALKRAEKYTKMLEDGRKADQDMSKIINARALAEWKELTRAGQKAHDSKTTQSWKAYEQKYRHYDARVRQINSHYDQLERQANQARLTDENNRKQFERRKVLQDANNAAAMERTRYNKTHSNSGGASTKTPLK